MRTLVERIVYGFLGWFESFNSVWQTTLLCMVIGAVEIAAPNLDRHLFAVLIISLYATFTQNGLAHENKLTSEKLDATLDALLALARDEVNERSADLAVQRALIAQGEAMTEIVRGLQTELAAQPRRRRG